MKLKYRSIQTRIYSVIGYCDLSFLLHIQNVNDECINYLEQELQTLLINMESTNDNEQHKIATDNMPNRKLKDQPPK